MSGSVKELDYAVGRRPSDERARFDFKVQGRASAMFVGSARSAVHA